MPFSFPFSPRLRGTLLGLACLSVVLPGLRAQDTAAPAPSVSTVPLQTPLTRALFAFAQTGSVLYVAAHPDDENTQLITYFARGRGLRTAYLSLTRGDGGQNESGPEFGEKLGLARTHELLAARTLDGGQQYFTRALDFGYSKQVSETLRFWDRREVLADMVRVIRTFRPDIIITRFSPDAGGTHGHHTASAVLALEAFRLAADPQAYPEQLTSLAPWQAKRILQNTSSWSPKPAAGAGPLFKIESNGRDVVNGQSFAAIAAQSRARHITQGFANFGTGTKVDDPKPESLAVLAGEPAAVDPFDGIDLSWRRFPDGDKLDEQVRAILAAFAPTRPEDSVPALLALRRTLRTSPAHPDLTQKLKDLDALLIACLGLEFRTRTARAWVTPGETIELSHELRAVPSLPLLWQSTRYPSLGREEKHEVALGLQPRQVRASVTVSAKAEPSQPYWLRQAPRDGLFAVEDSSLIGAPINPAAFPIEHVLRVGEETLVLNDEAGEEIADAPPAQKWRRLEIVAPVALTFSTEVTLFRPGQSKTVTVWLDPVRALGRTRVQLKAPAGWQVTPATQWVEASGSTERKTLTFSVRAPETPASAELRVEAEVEGRTYGQSRSTIRYRHLPELLLQLLARQTAVCLDLATTGQRVGYLPGAGDATAEALTEMGYTVEVLSGADLTPERLRSLDAVIVGVRAFNERTDLAANVAGLFAYAEQGGNVIVQYNRPNGLKTPTLAPFPLSIAGDAPKFRVTDETAPVTFLAPDHPALTRPNRLGEADFTGWVQERGAYFPSTWDENAFTAVLAMNDPEEAPLRGSLLVAPTGRGYFVYTGLAFFRQLPAGVPGSYRLLANLIALGK